MIFITLGKSTCAKSIAMLIDLRFILWINKIILTINQFIVRITIGYSKDKSKGEVCANFI